MTICPRTAPLLYDGMAMTNAERQARYHRRKLERIAECVTPGDVRRAVRLMYDEHAREPLNGAHSFEEWSAMQAKKRGGGEWMELVPSSASAEAYSDYFSEEDAALLARVGAVYEAMRSPPPPDL